MDGAYIALNRYNHLKTIETRSEKRMNRFKMIFEVIEVLCCLLSLFSFLISLLSFEFEVIFTLFILCLEWLNSSSNAKKNFYYHVKFHTPGGESKPKLFFFFDGLPKFKILDAVASQVLAPDRFTHKKFKPSHWLSHGCFIPIC